MEGQISPQESKKKEIRKSLKMSADGEDKKYIFYYSVSLLTIITANRKMK